MTPQEFEILFNQEQRRLFGFARHIIHNDEDAEGIMKDAFIKLWERGGHENPTSFLISCVKNSCLNYLKHEKRKSKHLSIIQEDLRNRFECAEIKSGLMELVCKEIETLPTQQKKILKLLSIGFNQVEIADILGLKPTTVATNIFRFREKMKKNLSHNGILETNYRI